MTIDAPAFPVIGTRPWPPPPPAWLVSEPNAATVPAPGPASRNGSAPDRSVPLMLSARGVRKTYRSGAHEVEALKGIDIDVAAGELVMVMGPSGNGKTTMLNCLSGLDEIDAGTVQVDGAAIHQMRDAKRTEHRARRMGFVFQSFNLIPVFTAEENVELPLLVTGVKRVEARDRARAMLDRVGLAERAAHRPNELSGGEQQRVAVARALVAEPAIIWADEPTGNLDSHTAAGVIELLHEVHCAGQTLVVITHDRGIGAHGQRLVQVLDGRITYDGPPAGHLDPFDEPAD